MFKKIESLENKKIKFVKKLANKKFRDEENKFVIEGLNVFSEAIKNKIEIDYILLQESSSLDLVSKLEIDIKKKFLTYIVPDKIFNKISDTEAGSGVMAVATKPDCDFEPRINSNVVVLDKIQDPGNIGSIIRSAVAFGYEMMVLIKGTTDIFSSKVLRSTAGMIFNIDIRYAENSEELKTFANNYNKKIVATIVKDGKSIKDLGLKKDIALVIGNEGNGISKEILDISDEKVIIPMSDSVESLNAAVAAGIVMYELQS